MTWSAPASVALTLRTSAGSTTISSPPRSMQRGLVTSPIGPEPKTGAVVRLAPDNLTAW